jgi:hypothetical protein
MHSSVLMLSVCLMMTISLQLLLLPVKSTTMLFAKRIFAENLLMTQRVISSPRKEARRLPRTKVYPRATKMLESTAGPLWSAVDSSENVNHNCDVSVGIILSETFNLFAPILCYLESRMAPTKKSTNKKPTKAEQLAATCHKITQFFAPAERKIVENDAGNSSMPPELVSCPVWVDLISQSLTLYLTGKWHK